MARRSNKTLNIEKMVISHCQKNRWDDDYAQHWFYAKIGFSDGKTPLKVIYPVASKIAALEHVNQAEFWRSSPGFKDCYSAF